MSGQIVEPEQARVLVVEDDPSNMLVAVKLLQLAGVPREHVYTIEGDPVGYLKEKLNGEVDLILLDLHMPVKDGYSILQEIRSDPELAHMRVVALTANVMLPNVSDAQAAGFDGFISKPIDGSRFTDWISRLLAGEAVWVSEW